MEGESMAQGPLTFDEAFGEIRSVLHGAPSYTAFSRLTSVLERMEAPARERLDPRYLDPVRRWSTTMRVLPEHWMKRAIAGEDVPFLDLCAHVTLMDLAHLAFLETEHARHARTLTFHGANLRMGLDAFMKGDRRHRLERIEVLHLFEVTPEALSWLSSLEAVESLREFSVQDYERLHDVSWRQRLEWPLSLESLEILSLEGDPDLEQLQELLEASPAVLRELHVRWDLGTHSFVWACELDEDSLAMLLACPLLARLEQLSLNHEHKRFVGRIDDEMAHTVCEAPCAETLKRLSLKGHNLTEAGVATLRTLPALTHLDVSDNDFDPDALTNHEEVSVEVVHDDCVPEEERSALEEHMQHSTFERVGAWGEHVDEDITKVCAGLVVLASLLHTIFVGSLPSHPLPMWVPLVLGLLLFPLRLVSWPSLTHILDWSALDEGSLPRHERRQTSGRALRGFLSVCALYALYLSLAVYACVVLGYAHPDYAWLEAVWWTFGPGLLFCIFVATLFAREWIEPRLRGH